jgi:hypothetical protein
MAFVTPSSTLLEPVEVPTNTRRFALNPTQATFTRVGHPRYYEGIEIAPGASAFVTSATENSTNVRLCELRNSVLTNLFGSRDTYARGSMDPSRTSRDNDDAPRVVHTRV